jgi:hypothetical protein
MTLNEKRSGLFGNTFQLIGSRLLVGLAFAKRVL